MTRNIGYVLLAASFLAGALIAVTDQTEVNWTWFSIAVAAGVVAIIMIRLSRRLTRQSAAATSANIRDLLTSLDRIAQNTARLSTEKDTIDTYDVHRRIDKLIAPDILIFVDARQTIADLCGLNTYAEVMNHFAAGERYLNRTWSASADGYVDEVNTFIQKSHDQFALALKLTTAALDNPPVS